MVFILDTETTSMRPGQIAQLSYILASNGCTVGKNFFFSVKEIDPESAAVNGLSVEKLALLSEGATFLKHAEEILADFECADYMIAHNVNFDLNFLMTEFNRLGLSPRKPPTFDTMISFTPVCKLPRRSTDSRYKFPKLTELTAHYGLSEDRIIETARTLYGGGGAYHDARFDTSATWLSCLEGRGDCVELNTILKSQDF